MTSAHHVYNTFGSTDLRGLELVDEYQDTVEALGVGCYIAVSLGYGSVRPIIILVIPDDTNPKTILDVEWIDVGVLPNEEKTKTVGREPNTTDTVG